MGISDVSSLSSGVPSQESPGVDGGGEGLADTLREANRLLTRLAAVNLLAPSNPAEGALWVWEGMRPAGAVAPESLPLLQEKIRLLRRSLRAVQVCDLSEAGPRTPH
ncbi:MAG: hypothetical protein HQL88_08110 [Magnetococcales bacterium]|nr:hypothetical protein [Magnetococcales bacterium]